MTHNSSLLTVFCFYLLIEIAFYPVIFIYFNPIGVNSFSKFFNLFLLVSSQLFLTIIGWCLTHFLYYFYHRNDRLDTKGKAVLITGCDSGLGLLTAKRLDKLGFNVFASVLFVDGEGAQQLRRECSKRIKIIKLDLKSDEEIKKAVDCVRKSGYELWALVNNAGVCFVSFTEFDSNSNMNQMTFDINYFGSCKLIQLCLPMLRKSKGRIVNITSVNAEFNFGMTTIYNASKHALRALSNGLVSELAPFGVKVICIEPGGFKTDIVKRIHENYERCLNQADPTVVADYQAVYRTLINCFTTPTAIKLRNFFSSGNFDEFTSAVEKALVNRHPKMCYRVTGHVLRPLWWLMAVVPDEISCWVNQLHFEMFIKRDCNSKC